MTRRRDFLALSAALVLSRKIALPFASIANKVTPIAANALLQRIVPNHAAQIKLRYQSSRLAGEAFSISGRNGSIEIEAPTTPALLMGVHWYLKYVAGVSISWNGDSLDKLPALLPAPQKEIRQQATVRHRFALNDTNDGYTGPYWTWPQWESLIDILALHGINRVLVYMGAEAVYQKTFLQFGCTSEELRRWFPTPAHQPWWLLQNISSWVGPSVSQSIIDSRLALAQKICARLRELDIVPVLPGYYGTVPDGFMQHNFGARVVPQGKWLGMKRPDWLDPSCESFGKVAQVFYKTQRELLGPSTMFKMDPLHEGGEAGSVSVTEAAHQIDLNLQQANPGATWAILGWLHNPRPDLLAGISDKSRVLVLDGVSDRYNGLDRETQWNNTPYAFGTVWNYGGHTTIGANLGIWNERFYKQLNKPGSQLQGIAVMPEQSCNNPLAFEFFTELAWRSEAVSTERWFRDWSAFRYGIGTTPAAQAWDILRRTAYNGESGKFAEPHDNLFPAQPSLTTNKACFWSPEQARYDLTVFAAAIDYLLNVPPVGRTTSAYRYDVVDVARQTISNESRILLPRIYTAYQEKNLDQFRRLARLWYARLNALEQVVSCDTAFMLGPWLAAARNSGKNEAEQKQFNFDACSLLVQWGPEETRNSFVSDYANREWAGLLNFYGQRWKRYFDSLETAMESGSEPIPIDWFETDVAWTKQDHTYTKEPQENFYIVIQQAILHRVS